MTRRRAAFGILAIFMVFIVGVGAFAAAAWRPEIGPVDGASSASFDPALIRRGAELAAMGDCADCHTAAGGKPFAGGRPISTPLGTVHSTNITPDRETGIGRWPELAFRRAMNEGVDRRGSHLYPAFPYDHFTLVSDDDNKALYAFLMTREPVHATAPDNHLPFPLNIRPLIAGWKLLFFRNERFRADPGQSEEINRGVYFAEGLGHCGACHTPRNALGAERGSRSWSGGEAEGWVAYAIDTSSPAPVPWDKTSLAFYFAHGWQDQHGVSRGPMSSVTADLGRVPPRDVDAIAAYVESRMGQPTPARRQRAAAALKETGRGPAPPAAADQQARSASGSLPGEAIYAGACAIFCHESGRAQPFGGLHFALSTAVNAPDPQNIINIVLYGLPPPEGRAGPAMPDFAGALNDGQIAAVLRTMRQRFGAGPAWPDLERRVRATRTGEHAVMIYRSDGTPVRPSENGQAETP